MDYLSVVWDMKGQPELPSPDHLVYQDLGCCLSSSHAPAGSS